MGVILLCVVLLAHGALGADSFWYILNPGVTNFTNYTTGAAAAVLANLPLRVRDGAVIAQKRSAERGYAKRLADDARALARRLFGPAFAAGRLGRALFKGEPFEIGRAHV